MRRLLIPLLILPLVQPWTAPVSAQPPPRDFDTLLTPQQTLPQGSPRPGGVQSAPLPPPSQKNQPAQKSAPPGGVPDIAAPPLARPGQPAQKGRKQQSSPSEVTVLQPPEQKIANPTATFSGLDKITGRIITFDVAINETVQFGALQVTPRICYSRPATEIQHTTSFVQVDEITLEGKMRRLFDGWMFAESPGLHAVEHAIYDVWLVDCKLTPPEVAKPRG
jgi:hypothetical protein